MVTIGFPSFVLQEGASGLSTYVTELLKALPSVDTHHRYLVFHSEQDRALLPPQVGSVEYHSASNYYCRPIPSIYWHNVRLLQEARKKQVDLVHIPCHRRVPVIRPGPLVVTVHDLAPLRIPGKYGRLRGIYHSQILKRLIFRADRVIVPSCSTRDDLVHFFAYPDERIDVIPLGINHGVFQPLDEGSSWNILGKDFGMTKPFLTYVSRIEHPGKNHVRLIEAFEIFKKRSGTEHQLVFAGKPWRGAEKVRKAARESSARDSIHFLGFVTQKQIVALYSVCDLMVFPSLYEGFGFPVLEAMACGARVVCSNSSSLKEIAGQDTHLFDPTSAISISLAIEKGLNGRKNLEHVHGYTWENTARGVLNTYQQVLECKSR